MPNAHLDKKEIVRQIKNSSGKEIDELLTYVIKEKLRQEKDTAKLYKFFTYIYENLYHDIIFKGIHIDEYIETALETLAMPIYESDTVDNILKIL